MQPDKRSMRTIIADASRSHFIISPPDDQFFGILKALPFLPASAGFFHAIERRGAMDNTSFKAMIAAVGTVATYLWGGWDAVLIALVTLACMDYLTGWAAAWVGKRLSSDVGRRGIAKKVGMFAIVAVCNVIDQVGGLGD